MMKLMILAFLWMSAAWAQPAVIVSPVDHLYVPNGFDSNDSVEIVVTGNFPNPCFSRNTVKVSVRNDTIDITITALSPELTRLSGRACPDMVVPFKEVVSVGNLQGGEYAIRVNRGSLYALSEKLQIAEATSSAVDDHVYAAIEFVEHKGRNEFLLRGWRYSSCYELDEIKVISNKKDTFSILPVMKQVSDFCPMKGQPVSYPVRLNFNELKTKVPLLHIRTMDGKSVNTIFNLEGRR